MPLLEGLVEVSRLGHSARRPGHHHSAAGDPHPARIRARRDFSPRKITRRERAGADFPHPDRRSNGANGFARRDHQRREAGSDDARQRAGDGRCGCLFPRGRSASGGRESGEFSQGHLAYVADDAAKRPRPGPAR